MYLGGLDVGTTGCKLSIYDENGSFIYNSYKEYEVTRQSGEHEIDGEAIFEGALEVIKDCASRYEIEAIGVTTFGETFVALDENDKALLPSMLYTDPRGKEECKILTEKLGEEQIISISGVKPNQMYSLPKVMWIKKNRPELFCKIKRILLIEDYIVYMLTGNAYIDYSLAARTMAFDIRKKSWSEEIFKSAEIDLSFFSKPVPAFNVAGELKCDIVKSLGLKKGFKVVNGSHDQVAAAVGSGVFESGQAVDGTGTVECITPVFDTIPDNKGLYDEGYSVVPYVFDGKYVCYALSFTGGASVKWFRDNFAKEKSYKELDLIADAEPTGILVLPHFAGAANPYMDSNSKAAILGLTLEHGQKDIYKAIMEGVTYEIMINAEHLEGFGIKLDKLFATGGGASSEVWLQIKADILNRKITSLEAKESGALGTCMMTGVAIGIYRDLYEAKERFVKEKKTFLPNPQRMAKYKDYYISYKKVYKAVKEVLQ